VRNRRDTMRSMWDELETLKAYLAELVRALET
jgi:hypothetical protein